MIVTVSGFIGSGKDTVSSYLQDKYNFQQVSFAGALKDAVASVFGWDRSMLEGRTAESRAWREQVDQWWSTRLNMNITPRWVLQYWGTDVLRNNFHDDIWIASLENKLRKTKDNIVISDVRFPNEVTSIHNAGGVVIRIKRGNDPDWFEDAFNVNAGPTNLSWAISKQKMGELKIHASETSWIGSKIDLTVSNDGSIDELFDQLESLVKNLESNHLAATELPL